MSPGDININLSEEEAEKVLEYLPGGPELYEQLADRFIEVLEDRDGVE